MAVILLRAMGLGLLCSPFLSMFRFLRLFVFGYHAYSLWLVLVFFVPTLAAQRLLHLYQQEKVVSQRPFG